MKYGRYSIARPMTTSWKTRGSSRAKRVCSDRGGLKTNGRGMFWLRDMRAASGGTNGLNTAVYGQV